MKKIIEILENPISIFIYLMVICAFIFRYLFKQREAIWQILTTANYSLIFCAFFFGCLNLIFFCYAIFVIYQKLGAKLSFWESLQIVIVSRLGVYIPGKIWYATNFYIFSRKFNIAPTIISQSFILCNIFLFATGGALSLPIILPLFPYYVRITSITLVILLFIIIHPKVLQCLISYFPYIKQKFNKLAYFERFSNQIYFKLLGLFLFLWLIAGTKLFFCVLAISNLQYSDFFVILPASAASLLTGLVAIFAPAGIGVNEGIGSIVISQIVPFQIAFLGMVISRLLLVFTELGIGVLFIYLFNIKKSEINKVTLHKD